MNDGSQRFSAARLCGFIGNAFSASGMPEEDAQAIADLMSDADLNGSDGHGIFRLPAYIRRLGEGGLNLHQL